MGASAATADPSSTVNSYWQQFMPKAAPNVTSNFAGYTPAQTGPTAANNTLGQIAGRQGALASTEGTIAAGGGPNLAEEQLKQATAANLATQLATQGSLGSGNQPIGAATRAVDQNAANTLQTAAGQSAIDRTQAQQAALGGEAGALSGEAGTTANLAGNEQALDLANTNALNTAGQFNSTAQQTLGGLLNTNNNINNALLNSDTQGKNSAMTGLSDQDLANQQAMAMANNPMSILGSTIGALGGIGASFAKSDEESKTDIEPDPTDMKALLEHISTQSYRYKDPQSPGAAPGQHFGPMAQDLEKGGPVGKSMVADTDSGKMVDTPRAVMALLGAAGDLNSRLEALEVALKKKGKGKN